MKSKHGVVAAVVVGVLVLAAGAGCSAADEEEATAFSEQAAGVTACANYHASGNFPEDLCDDSPIWGARECDPGSSDQHSRRARLYCCPRGSVIQRQHSTERGGLLCAWLDGATTASTCNALSNSCTTEIVHVEGGVKCGPVAANRKCCPYNRKLRRNSKGYFDCVAEGTGDSTDAHDRDDPPPAGDTGGSGGGGGCGRPGGVCAL